MAGKVVVNDTKKEEKNEHENAEDNTKKMSWTSIMRWGKKKTDKLQKKWKETLLERNTRIEKSRRLKKGFKLMKLCNEMIG